MTAPHEADHAGGGEREGEMERAPAGNGPAAVAATAADDAKAGNGSNSRQQRDAWLFDEPAPGAAPTLSTATTLAIAPVPANVTPSPASHPKAVAAIAAAAALLSASSSASTSASDDHSGISATELSASSEQPQHHQHHHHHHQHQHQHLQYHHFHHSGPVGLGQAAPTTGARSRLRGGSRHSSNAAATGASAIRRSVPARMVGAAPSATGTMAAVTTAAATTTAAAVAAAAMGERVGRLSPVPPNDGHGGVGVGRMGPRRRSAEHLARADRTHDAAAAAGAIMEGGDDQMPQGAAAGGGNLARRSGPRRALVSSDADAMAQGAVPEERGQRRLMDRDRERGRERKGSNESLGLHSRSGGSASTVSASSQERDSPKSFEDAPRRKRGPVPQATLALPGGSVGLTPQHTGSSVDGGNGPASRKARPVGSIERHLPLAGSGVTAAPTALTDSEERLRRRVAEAKERLGARSGGGGGGGGAGATAPISSAAVAHAIQALRPLERDGRERRPRARSREAMPTGEETAAAPVTMRGAPSHDMGESGASPLAADPSGAALVMFPSEVGVPRRLARRAPLQTSTTTATVTQHQQQHRLEGAPSRGSQVPGWISPAHMDETDRRRHTTTSADLRDRGAEGDVGHRRDGSGGSGIRDPSDTTGPRRRSNDGEGPRRRSNDGEGPRRRSNDGEGPRRRSNESSDALARRAVAAVPSPAVGAPSPSARRPRKASSSPDSVGADLVAKLGGGGGGGSGRPASAMAAMAAVRISRRSDGSRRETSPAELSGEQGRGLSQQPQARKTVRCEVDDRETAGRVGGEEQKCRDSVRHPKVHHDVGELGLDDLEAANLSFGGKSHESSVDGASGEPKENNRRLGLQRRSSWHGSSEGFGLGSSCEFHTNHMKHLNVFADAKNVPKKKERKERTPEPRGGVAGTGTGLDRASALAGGRRREEDRKSEIGSNGSGSSGKSSNADSSRTPYSEPWRRRGEREEAEGNPSQEEYRQERNGGEGGAAASPSPKSRPLRIRPELRRVGEQHSPPQPKVEALAHSEEGGKKRPPSLTTFAMSVTKSVPAMSVIASASTLVPATASSVSNGVNETQLARVTSKAESVSSSGSINRKMPAPAPLAQPVQTSVRREKLIDTLTILSFHAPRCVLGDMTVFEEEGKRLDAEEEEREAAAAAGRRSAGLTFEELVSGSGIIPIPSPTVSSDFGSTRLEDVIESETKNTPISSLTGSPGTSTTPGSSYDAIYYQGSSPGTIAEIDEAEDSSIDLDEIRAVLPAATFERRASSTGAIGVDSRRGSNERTVQPRSVSMVMGANAITEGATTTPEPTSRALVVPRTAVGSKKHAHLRIDRDRILRTPYFNRRESALLFVDISGFTRLSTLLEVENLSKAINSYFEMMVDEVISSGGDVLKFAGDAFFAEWQALPPADGVYQNEEDTSRPREGRTLAECAYAAAACGATIVEECSDFHVSHLAPGAVTNTGEDCGVLNVHCGLGVGHMVGLHVGDNEVMNGGETGDDGSSHKGRREYLFLGDSIDQAAEAADKGTDGELLASPQTIKLLATTHRVPPEILRSKEPSIIASRSDFVIKPRFGIGVLVGGMGRSEISVSTFASKISVYDSLRVQCDGMDDAALRRLCQQLALYVHPAARKDGDIDGGSGGKGGNAGSTALTVAKVARTRSIYRSRQRADAELRSVFIMFVNIKVDTKITGDDVNDGRMFNTLNGVMRIASREIGRYRGHIRQFIVDDKGVVLIATFGLRGSAFPNMVPNNALPATLALHAALLDELDVDNRIGATYGMVYCGVVGGVRRHEFAVMGAPVNLAARLMANKQNEGILVDEAVQLQASGRFLFKSLPSVKAKGYADPVPTFQPLQKQSNKEKLHVTWMVKRREHSEAFLKMADRILSDFGDSPAQTVFLYGESGTGKSALLNQVGEEIKDYGLSRNKDLVIAKATLIEKEQMVPLSGFRDIFLSAIAELCAFEGIVAPVASNAQVSRRHMMSSRMVSSRMVSSRNFKSFRRTAGRQARRSSGFSGKSMRSMRSVRSLRSHATQEVPYFSKLCWVCNEIGYRREFADIVGTRLLGLEEADQTRCSINGKVPTLDEMAEFLIRAFIKFTECSDLTLISFDDAQWIDSLSWKVIHGLGEKGNNLIFICAMRAHKASRRLSWVKSSYNQTSGPRCTEMSLGPFTISEVRELISHSLEYDEDDLDDTFVSDVQKRTSGLPVFVAEFMENIKRNSLVEEKSGKVGWRQCEAVKKFLCKTNSVVVFEELFLQRFDSLDSSVRKILQTCALLGSEFTLLDIVRVHPDLVHCDAEEVVAAAVQQCILIEEDLEEENSMEDCDDTDSEEESDDFPKNNSSNLSWHPFEDKTYRFSHAIWRNCVLKTMLKERKLELHRTIAKSIEEDAMFDINHSDTEVLLQLFEHWKFCGEFVKAAPLALAVGSRIKELDSLRQSLDLYNETLNMLELEPKGDWQSDGRTRELKAELLQSASLYVLELIIRLYSEIAKCSGRMGNREHVFYAYREAYAVMRSSPRTELISRGVVLGVLSGLSQAMSEKQVVDQKQVSLERDLVKRFAYEARLDGNPVHMCRALAMEASYFSRIGDFNRALDAQKLLEGIYFHDLYSAPLINEYGHDSAAQCFSDSVLWYFIVGDTDQAKKQIEHVIQNHLPKVNPRDVDNTMSLIFPLLLGMKELRMAERADDILKRYVSDRFHEFGCSLNHWLTLYKPIVSLLQVATMDEMQVYHRKTLEEIESWILKHGASCFSPSMQRDGYILVGELCWRISRRKLGGDEKRQQLAAMGIDLLNSALSVKGGSADEFMLRKAEFILQNIREMKDRPQVKRRNSLKTAKAKVFGYVRTTKKTTKK